MSTPVPALDAERRRSLDATRLGVVVAGHAPGGPRELVTFAGGVALVGDADVWVLPADAGRLGAVLAWAGSSAPGRELDVVGDDPGVAARRAAGLVPPVRVWRITGRTITRAEPAPAPTAAAPPEAPELVVAMTAAGLDVVVEHGVVTGEVKGLEVARIVPAEPRPYVAIGVGVYDQGAFSAMNADRTLDGTEDPERLVADLASVRDRILAHRGPSADPHVANRLVRPRWLRASALGAPEVVGLVSLRPVPLVDPRPGLNEHAPAAAVGHDADGLAVLALFSVGVDLELVAVAAELLGVHAVDRVRLVLPARDHHRAIEQAATRLMVPADLVALEGEWAA